MHSKQNNKESKTYVQGLRPFINTLPRGVKGILKKNGYNYSEIISKWKILVGKNISENAYPKSIKLEKNNSGGTLVLAIKRGEEINIEYSKKKIIDQINSYFGYKLINKIKLQILNTIEEKKKKKKELINFSKNYKKKINEIKNEKIRNSLTRFLDTIQNG